MGEYSVVQFFEDGQYEYVRRFVDAEAAVLAARHYCCCVGARVGTTVRVIITDGGDHCTFEWQRVEGVVFPEQYKGLFKEGNPHAKPPTR